MSERAARELASWGAGLVSVTCDGPVRSELLLRLESVSVATRQAGMVSLKFERNSYWWVENIIHADVSPHEVFLHQRHGQYVRLKRLLLPTECDGALHVGQFSTKELGLPSLATPFEKSWSPGAPRRRPRALVVWTEFAARTRIALWWACASYPGVPIWVIPLPRDWPAQEEVGCLRRVSELMAAAPAIRRLTAREASRFASNWRAWQRGEPRFRAVDLETWPAETRWVGEVPERIVDLMPRYGAELRLSPYDVQVLELWGNEWASTREALRPVLRGPDTTMIQLWDGAHSVHRRIDAWSRWQHGTYVERRPTGAEGALSAFAYRLTDEGRALLNALPSLDAAPPFVHGAFRFYAPNSWVLGPNGPMRAPKNRVTSRRR